MQEYAALYLQKQRLERARKDAAKASLIREALSMRPKWSERVGVALRDLRSNLKPGVVRPAH